MSRSQREHMIPGSNGGSSHKSGQFWKIGPKSVYGLFRLNEVDYVAFEQCKNVRI